MRAWTNAPPAGAAATGVMGGTPVKAAIPWLSSNRPVLAMLDSTANANGASLQEVLHAILVCLEVVVLLWFGSGASLLFGCCSDAPLALVCCSSWFAVPVLLWCSSDDNLLLWCCFGLLLWSAADEPAFDLRVPDPCTCRVRVGAHCWKLLRISMLLRPSKA